ncbi:TPA: hypothetical protein OUF49_004863 [Enterobacter asburiae]|nr:hypothetical protein [Enterobacter asburiae]HCU0704170.1 hypothetical protein [Enterobacter asburiae]
MSVPNQIPYIIYNANGLTTVFPFEFYIINSGDIQVTINGTVITSGYTVSGAGNVGGGDVIFLTPPANGSVVMLERVVPTYRLTDYQDNGDLLADTVNKDFDRIWMAIQRSSIYLGLALRRPLFGGPFNAEGYRVAKGADPIDKQDFATKNYIDSVALNRVLRVPDSYVDPLPPLGQLEGKVIGFVNGRPTGLPPSTGSATDIMVQLLKQDGLKYIGACRSINHLRGVNGDFNGQQIFLTSVVEGKNTGGGIFLWDSSATLTDDSGCIIKPTATATGRWIRQRNSDRTPEMFGAIGDGVADDTAAIQRMFNSGRMNTPTDIDMLYNSFRMANKYLISSEIKTCWLNRVDATGARFIVNSSITAINLASLRNGEWIGGFFDYSGIPNASVNENAVALWPLKDVDASSYGLLQVMHAKIRGVKTLGVHTGIKIKPNTGLTWQSEIELCELGVRSGASTQKAHAINIEATGPAGGGGSTTLSIRKCSTHDGTNSPLGVGRGGYRIWNISGVDMFECSYDLAEVSGGDMIEIFANNVEIDRFYTERVTNVSAIGADGPIRILGNNVVITNTQMTEKATSQNNSWISVYNAGNGANITLGNWMATDLPGSTPHLEYVIDMSRDLKNALNVIGNVNMSQVYGYKNRQNIFSSKERTTAGVWSLNTVTSRQAFFVLNNTLASYELLVRGDGRDDGTLAFLGNIKVVRSRDSTTWTVKYDFLNSAGLSSTTYPVTITVEDNTLVFNNPSTQVFNIQTKVQEIMTVSESY